MTKKAFLRREAGEYMDKIVITCEERQELLSWIKDGNSVYDNPWHMADEGGCPMDYISACREVDNLKLQNDLSFTPVSAGTDFLQAPI